MADGLNVKRFAVVAMVVDLGRIAAINAVELIRRLQIATLDCACNLAMGATGPPSQLVGAIKGAFVAAQRIKPPQGFAAAFLAFQAAIAPVLTGLPDTAAVVPSEARFRDH